MKETRFNPEILAPAGDLEKLTFAYHYGADAAYIGGGSFSLRAGAGLSLEDIKEGIRIARSYNKKIYIALNVFAHNEDIVQLPDYLHALADLQPDALIVSDPGVFTLCRSLVPQIPVHISTQANNTNYLTASFWAGQGATRIVLARELSLQEATLITEKCAPMETELFVHGAMCISYSGRCLISHVLTDRSANKGACSHPCRWKYALQEEKRPGEYFSIEEDMRGSYIMNSKDLCLIGCMDALIGSGIASWKIEGRQKSAYYVANTVRIYKAALQAYYNGTLQEELPYYYSELQKVSHRDYTTGFALGKPNEDAMRYEDGQYIRTYDFTAIINRVADGMLHMEQRNYFRPGDVLEILLPNGRNLTLPVAKIHDAEGIELDAARHPRQFLQVPLPDDVVLPQGACPLICRKAVD